MIVSKRLMNRRIKNLLLLTAVSSMTVLIVMLLMVQAERNIANESIRNAAQRAAGEFQRLVRGVEGALTAARQFGVDPGGIDMAKHYFDSSIFPNISKLSGISLVEKGGHAFYLYRDGSMEDMQAQANDDQWFEDALENPEYIVWSGIHPLRTSGASGLSVSLSWTGRNGSPVVAAYHILLDDFLAEVQSLRPTPSSLAFVFVPNGMSGVPVGGGMLKRLSVPVDQEELARAGLSAWEKRPPENGRSDVRVFTTRIDGTIWWCGFTPMGRPDQEVWMCVMVPKSDLVENVSRHRRTYAGVGLMVLVGMVGVYRIVLKRSSTPRFGPAIDAGQIRMMIDRGENSTVEFKSTMRMNLHSKKPGREIELAWLKGVAAFLNTNGGTLLLGVTDAGEVTGLEQDVFENDDKCRLHFKNLIARALGADLSQFIRFMLASVEGKTVGVVQCVRASRPVYLRDGNKETFYIRNGPSSDELPASRMVDYIAEHWK